MATSTGGKVLRIGAIVLGCLLAAAGGAALWLRANYKTVIRKKLPGIVAKATDSLYQVKAGDFDVDLDARRVVITDFDFVPDRDAVARLRSDFRLPKLLLAIHIDTITMEDVDWKAVLRTKEIACGRMRIAHPVVQITKLGGESDTTDKGPKEPSRIKAIAAGSILITDPDVTLRSAVNGKKAAYRMRGGQVALTDWRFDLGKAPDSTRLFYSTRTVFTIRSFSIEDDEGLYDIRTGDITYDQQSSRATVRNFAIKPALSREAFYRRVRKQQEIYTLRVPELTLNGLLWTRLLRDGELIADAPGRIAGADLSVYMSRVPPPGRQNRNGRFPQQLLQKLALPVFIPRLDLVNGHLTYTEKNDRTLSEGTLELKAAHGTLQNITNKKELLRKNGTSAVALHATFLGAPLDATFHFNLRDPRGAFTMKAHGGAFAGPMLNSVTKPLALAEVSAGTFDALDVDLTGSERGAQATMTLRYHDLETDLFKIGDAHAVKRDKLFTFAANKLLTHASNPGSDGELRVVHPTFQRDPTKSFFNMIWGTMFTGALQSVSRKVVKLDKMANKRKEKQAEKRLERGK